jgi:hypothetical protein
MNLYKEIPCENYSEVNAEILRYITSLGFVESTQAFWNPIDSVEFFKNTPLFQKWTMINNIMIKSVAVTVGKRPDCCGPHVDTPPARYKLSWPVLNTEQSFNRWFREKNSDCQTVTNSYEGKTYLNPDDLEEIGRRTVSCPAIIDAGIPHDVQFLVHDPVWPRIGLQCQLFKEPTVL